MHVFSSPPGYLKQDLPLMLLPSTSRIASIPLTLHIQTRISFSQPLLMFKTFQSVLIPDFSLTSSLGLTSSLLTLSHPGNSAHIPYSPSYYIFPRYQLIIRTFHKQQNRIKLSSRTRKASSVSGYGITKPSF